MSTPVSSTTSSTSGSATPVSTTTSGAASTSAIGTNAPFQISGIVSGLDTAAIVDKLVAVYSAPMKLVQADEVKISQKQAAWNDIQAKMTALQTAIQTLQAPAAASGRMTSVVPPAGQTVAPMTATATPSAAQGSFTVTVNNLATTASLVGRAGITNPITVANAGTSTLTSLSLGVKAKVGTLTVNGTVLTVDGSTTLLGGVGSNSIQAKINAISGLSFTANNDGLGNLTGVTIASTTTPGTPIQLGTAGDTSNVVAALHLNTAVPVTAASTYSLTTNGSLSGISLSTALPSANLAGTPSANGSLSINGVSISYLSTDTLGSLIGAINASKAGVTATYDALSDRVTLAANATGTGGISVTDPAASGMAAALGLLTGSTSNAGLPASVTISGVNGGNPIASASNTVTGIIPGVTLNLTGASIGGATTIAIVPDNSALTTALQGFVTAYNNVQDTVAKYGTVTLDQTGKPQSAGILTGDPSLSNLTTELDQTVNDTTATVGGKSYSLANLGISTGAVGSFVAGRAPTLDLTFDTTKLASLLSATPTLGQAFIGNGSVSSQKGTLFYNLNAIVNTWTSPLGNLGTSIDALTAGYANDEQSIRTWQDLITSQRAQLTKTFNAMETSLSHIQAQGQVLASALGYTNTTTGSGTSKA